MSRRMILGAKGCNEMKKYTGTFVGNGTASAYLDINEDLDIISVIREDAGDLSNGLSRGVFGFSITRDMYGSSSYISSDGAKVASNGGVFKVEGMYAAANLYAKHAGNKIELYAYPGARPFAIGVTYKYVCVKY